MKRKAHRVEDLQLPDQLRLRPLIETETSSSAVVAFSPSRSEAISRYAYRPSSDDLDRALDELARVRRRERDA